MRFTKRWRALLAAVSSISIMLAGYFPVGAAGENLLVNGDFENGLNGWEIYMNEPSVEVSAVEKHAGTGAVKLNGIGEEGEEHWNKIRQTVEVYPNTSYTVTGWAKITGAPIDTWKSKFDIEDADYKPFVTLRIHDMGTKPTGDWQEFSFEFNSGDNDLIRIALCADNGGKNNIHYYDDLVMTITDGTTPGPEPSASVGAERPEGSGLIQNGSFENGNLGWESGWTAAETIVETEQAEGSKSLKITDCRWQSNVHQFITVKPNTDYVISFMAKVTRAEDEWSTLVKVGENEMTLEELGSVNMRTSSSWREYEIEISTGNLSEVCLMILGNVSEFYVDDFRMHPKGTEPVDGPGDIANPVKPQTFLDTLRGTQDESGKIRLVIDDTLIETDCAPLIVNGRVLIPARALCEAIGAKIGWNDRLYKISIFRNGTFMTLTVGDTIATLDGSPVDMDAAPMISGERTFIPVRFVSDAFNLGAEWLDAERIVALTGK